MGIAKRTGRLRFSKDGMLQEQWENNDGDSIHLLFMDVPQESTEEPPGQKSICTLCGYITTVAPSVECPNCGGDVKKAIAYVAECRAHGFDPLAFTEPECPRCGARELRCAGCEDLREVVSQPGGNL